MPVTLVHSNTVSGTTIFDDNTKVYWTEGYSDTVVVCPDGRHVRFSAESNAPILDHLDQDGDQKRMMTDAEELEWATARNTPTPESTGPITIRNFEYEPGGKWECGILNFDADTPIGVISWREIIPGPRHGEDAAELDMKLNGNDVDIYEPGTTTCYQDFDYPDFEPPNNAGKRAKKFKTEGKAEIAEILEKWIEENKNHEAIARALVPPPVEKQKKTKT